MHIRNGFALSPDLELKKDGLILRVIVGKCETNGDNSGYLKTVSRGVY